MREGKYVDELLKVVRELPDDAGLDANEFVQVASIVARRHPVWYERFFWRDKCVKWWRRRMGDWQNLRRDLKAIREMRRSDDWRGIALEVVSWLVALGLVFGLLKWWLR